MLIRLPLTSLKGTYAHMKYYFTFLVLLYGKIQTYHEQKRRTDGPPIFSVVTLDVWNIGLKRQERKEKP